MVRNVLRRRGALGALLLGLLALPFLGQGPAAADATAQPAGLDHFLCYDFTILGPVAEQTPFGLMPAAVDLQDQFGRLRVTLRLPDRLCNPVNKILPTGQGFPPQNPNAHLVCDPFDPATQPPPPKLPLNVRVENQFGKARLRVTERDRLCLPSWKNDPQNPTGPGSVPVPVPAGTPVQPPNLDHFLCYQATFLGNATGQFPQKPPSVTLVDQFGTRQVNVGNPDRLCNPVNKLLLGGQQFPPANPKAHLVCFALQSGAERTVLLQNQFGTGRVLATVATRLCLPTFKQRIRPPVPDFDGDGDTDIAVFRPSNGVWYVLGGGATAWGVSGDVPVPGDYDGNGTDDMAVFRPSTGVWYVLGGSPPTFVWGVSGDIAAPGDYDGDGKTDAAVFRPSTGTFFIRNSGGPAVAVPWGVMGDIPVPGDYDGDGDTDIAVFRPSNGVWYVMGTGSPAWGVPGDVPAPADFDGDGDTDIAVFRPSNGVWYVMGGGATLFGVTGDRPAPGDYDGDGDADIAVFRPSNGVWYVMGDGSPAWGVSGDIPLSMLPAVRQVLFP